VRPLTQVGVVVGSPDYMSPEQTLGSTVVDHRADIWALCVVLYEAMCGCRPFDGKDFKALALAINIDEPAPITDHGAGDAALWAIMRQALDKDPEKRWKSMRAMGCAFAGWLAQHGARTDVTGAALEAHWLNEQAARVLSEPPVVQVHEPSDAPTVEIAVGSGRSRKAVWIAVALLALCAALLVWDRVIPRQQPVQLEARAPIVVDVATATIAEAPAAEAPPSAATAPGEDAPAPARSVGPRTTAPLVVPKRQQAGPDDPGF
jgi:serine/threonine-protein kinase